MVDEIDIDWSCENSQLIAWDDGHTPETFEASDAGGLRIYPEYHDSANSFIRAIPNAGPPELADAIYKFTIEQPEPAWGTYVLWEDALRNANDAKNQTPSLTTLDELAVQAAAVFVQQQTMSLQAHGIAVWALAANARSCVNYHIDYAEWLRYRYNMTVLPILAGTWQCTRSEANINGGEFWAHEKGLEHYKQHGYKAALCPINAMDEYWVKIPYRFNQLIVQSGQLPHLSTNVNSIEDNWKRVIVGFNVFLSDVGPLVQESPEHSEAFRTRVQSMRLQQQRLHSIRKMSQKMKRMLVMAKRQKVKADYRKAQAQLDELIQNHLNSQDDNAISMDAFLSSAVVLISDDCWPYNEDDIRAHVLRRCKDGFLTERCDGTLMLGKHEQATRSLTNGHL